MYQESTKNVLVLAHRAPYPPDRGDRIRTYHILRHLASRCRVYLGALLDEPINDESLAALRGLTTGIAMPSLGRQSRWVRAAWSLATGGAATEGLFASPELRNQVRQWARTVRFDAAIAFCTSMVQFTHVPELADVPLIVDLIDADSQKWFDYAAAAKGVKRPLFALEGRRVRNLECLLPRRAAAITLVSQAEADLYRSFCPNDKTLALHNGVDSEYFSDNYPAPESRPNQCVFVGVLDYRATVESLVWFCREVWPRIIARKPNAVFAIVGKNPAPAVQRLAAEPGIRLVGPVPDVRPYVMESRFAVAPLLIARGIQNKVLEAMAMGKPVIASPQTLEGLTIEPGREVVAAASPAEWTDAMLRLYADDCLVETLGSRAREFVQAHHSWSACLAPIDYLLGLTEVSHRSAALTPTMPVPNCALA